MNAEAVLVAWAPVADAAGLAAAAATELLGRHPGPLHHHCPRCGSVEHGRPSYDAAIEVSIAHAAGLSVVAISTAGPVGVDAEPDAGRRACRDGIRLPDWVRAEAIGKAYGVGLAGPAGPAQVTDLAIPGHVAALAVRAARLPEIRLAAPEAPASPATR